MAEYVKELSDSDNFNNLSSKIIQLRYGRTKDERYLLNETLNELNSLNYKYLIIKNCSKALLLINQCCTLISTDDTELVLKCCQLITNLIKNQNLRITDRTLNISIQWCLQTLKEKSDPVIELKALEALIGNTSLDNFISPLIIINNNAFISLTKNLNCLESVLIALQCLECCIAPININDGNSNKNQFVEQFKICFNIFLNHLSNENNNDNTDKAIKTKILITCLKGLQHIIEQDTEYLSATNLGLLLGIVKTFMLYDIKGIEFIKPQKLMPSNLNIPEESSTNNITREKTGGKVTKQRKQRTNQQSKSNNKKPNNTNVVTCSTDLNSLSIDEKFAALNYHLRTSDSDFSENDLVRNKDRLISGHVRQAALYLFLKIIKLVEKHVIFSYWSNFIPVNTLTDQHFLTNCILKDPSTRGRMLALNVLIQLLQQSKLYLSQAEKSNEHFTAFTPYSVILGLMLIELHKCLRLALNEHSIPVLIQILKCLSALVQATPYHRLNNGLLTKLIRNIKSFIYHKDPSVQVSSLIVLGCILANEPIMSETRDIFIKHKLLEINNCNLQDNNGSSDDNEIDDLNCNDNNLENNKQISWLLEKCINNLLSTDIIVAVKLESLQIISAMSRNYFDILILGHLNLITKAINQSLLDKSMDLKLHAGRTIDFLGQAMNRYYNNEVDSEISNEFLTFWNILLNKSLIDLLQCEQHSILRAIGCDCLSSIGAYAFEYLPRDKQLLCVTLLFTCSRDDENNVKGAAVRALAICVSYPSLRDDSGFVIDTIEAIYRTISDENLSVRVKAYWSLGNLSDVIVLNRSTNQTLIDELPNNLLIKLINISIKGANDNDKIRMNAVRALGNLLQLITNELSNELIFKNLINESFQVLVENSITGSNMKVRWNCCYALGNAMKNSALYNNYSNSNWQGKVFNALMDLVKNCKNFKVRINSAVALSCPLKRDFYSKFFIPIWLSLLIALENSQNINDFREYNHRDNLIDQICLCLGYLTTLLTIEDLIPLFNVITPYYDLMKIHMLRVLERLLPEKSTILFDAKTYLDLLNCKENLISEQKSILIQLKQVFVNDL